VLVTVIAKISLYSVVACGLIGLGGWAFAHQANIARQADDWLLMPRPQRLTELYFADHRHLPTSLRPGATVKLAFTVHNLEQQPTSYHYRMTAMSLVNSAEQPLGAGVFTIASDEYKTMAQNITVPLITARSAIKVTLDYEGLGSGEHAPSPKTQSIHFWADATSQRSKS